MRAIQEETNTDVFLELYGGGPVLKIWGTMAQIDAVMAMVDSIIMKIVPKWQSTAHRRSSALSSGHRTSPSLEPTATSSCSALGTTANPPTQKESMSTSSLTTHLPPSLFRQQEDRDSDMNTETGEIEDGQISGGASSNQTPVRTPEEGIISLLDGISADEQYRLLQRLLEGNDLPPTTTSASLADPSVLLPPAPTSTPVVDPPMISSPKSLSRRPSPAPSNKVVSFLRSLPIVVKAKTHFLLGQEPSNLLYTVTEQLRERLMTRYVNL